MPTPPARHRRRRHFPEWAFIPLGCLAIPLLWFLGATLFSLAANRMASTPPPDPATLAHRLGLLPNADELRQQALGMAQKEARRRRAYREYVKQRQRYSGRRR